MKSDTNEEEIIFMAKCKACGRSTGFSVVTHFVPDQAGRKHVVCKECAAAALNSGKYLQYDPQTDRVIMINRGDAEIRRQCRTCGHIMCFTNMDLFQNQQAAKNARWNAVASAANALGGNYAASAINQANATNQVNQIRNYSKCPACGSIDLVDLSREDFARLQQQSRPQFSPVQQPAIPQPQPQEALPAVDPIAEIKKFKELLDMGIISQEEFAAKKKQLLGL